VELEARSRHTSLVTLAVLLRLAGLLLATGMFLPAWFFLRELTSTKDIQVIYAELLTSLVASQLTGFGVLFLLLWVGIHV
uniref:Dolichyl-diphosphooligosaccharide-protein glycosyltransferase subunit TMEM258 n=1 Tax=Catagonus wagneri TaxID=51154 RepID=A0A8C3YCS0_9CETA